MSDRKKIAIVGTGLIGGSLALQLNEKGLASTIIGVDSNEAHAKMGLRTGATDHGQHARNRCLHVRPRGL